MKRFHSKLTFVLICMLSTVSSAAITFLTAPDGDAYNRFGNSIAFDHDELMVASPGNCSDGEYQGAVYFYIQNEDDGDWQLNQLFNADDTGPIDVFGRSVDFCQHWAIVSARSNCTITPNSGVVFIFERIGDQWSQVEKFTATNPYAADNYGMSVAINENFAAVGAPMGGVGVAGAVYLYKRHGGEWIFDSQIYADDSQTLDYFGYSLSLYDDTLVVGSPRVDAASFNPKSSGVGAAYVFEHIDDHWQQIKKISANDPTANNQFGFSVSIDKDHLVIGAPKDDVLDFDSGSAYIYEKNRVEGWIFETKLSALDADSGDVFGASVAVSDDYIIIGAPGVDGRGENSGAIYSYLRTDQGWTQKAKKSMGDADAGDRFGETVAISPVAAAAGAPSKEIYSNESQGAVYVMDNIEDLALPVQLVNFAASVRGVDVLLSWQTFSELDNLGFILQRKDDKCDWEEIASFQTHPELLGRGSATSLASYSFVDQNVDDGFYSYRIGDVDLSGQTIFHTTTSLQVGKAVSEAVPTKHTLYPAFPNPFNPATTIEYYLSEQCYVDLGIYDVSGRKVSTLVQDIKVAGRHRAMWRGVSDDGVELGSGVFFVRLFLGNEINSQKIIRVR